MPATDQTWYPMNVLHRVFALASLALLAATVWLLIQDHRRPWKQYQRTANRIDRQMAAWRESPPNAEAGPVEPRYFHFDRGFPRPGRKLLELPIVDAFNSPLRIENLWAEGLTQDYHFREVPRFDRCTTCHTAIQKTELGSADSPAYPREDVLEFTLAVAEAASGSAGDPAREQSLDDLFGLHLADQGLLNPHDVIVSYVRPATPAALAALVAVPPATRSAEQIMRDLFQMGDSDPPSRPAPGLRAGDVLVAIDGSPVTDRPQAVGRLLAADADLVLTVRRGLPHPFASHPRLDLFVGELSPHKMSDFACTVCHEGQGSATEFKWASHAPNDLAQRKRWRDRHGWFENPFWDFPMHPRRFIESSCVKCHHRVVDLQPSPRYPQPPAPKLLRGYTLVRTYGCFGCHEINGFQEGRSVGPDLHIEQRDVETPGGQRPPGPNLRHLGDSVTDAFLHDWLRDPRRFRPTTQMPRSFGLWDHLEGSSREIAQRYEPLEIRGIVAYLRASAADPGPADSPAGIAAATDGERAGRGRMLFQTRGCLACHSHTAFAGADKFRDSDEPAVGPDLSNLADKLTGESSRTWLTGFVRRPQQYLPRTVMPDLLLEPISHRDVAGQVMSITDPAEDIAEFLLQGSSGGYQPQLLPEIDRASLDQLTLEYLRGVFHEGKAKEYVERGIPARLTNTLPMAERELLVANRDGGAALGRAGGSPGKLSVGQKLRYVGRKSIGKYGCFGCHDIPGFETAKQIGPPLSEWGRKDPKQLAFEHITAYLSARDGSSSRGGAEPTPEAAETEAYFHQQLTAASRIGFTYQKLAEPRSYDYHVAEQKAYHDRLRMPQFPFSAEDREAIITFLLGLVARPPAEKYVYVPDASRAAIIDGEEVLERYQCASCHVLEPQKWHLAYRPGAFRPQPDKPVFPWVDHPFDEHDLQASRQSDARGLLHATLAGMPTLTDSGRPLVFDDSGDELFEDEDYLPQTLEYPFQLWQPAALDGRGYQVGRGAVTVLGEQVVARQRARGGFLPQYLLPHVTQLERAVNPNAKGSEAWGWLPPPLLGEGAKVQPGWLYDYLLAPYRIRPASLMRMPNYQLSSAEARVLVNYFAAQDRVDFPYQSVDRRSRAYLQQAQAAYRRQQAAGDGSPPESKPADSDHLAAAMRIVTDKNYCVTCHIIGDFDPRTSDRAKGPDLAGAYQRFRPEYLRRWLAEPVSVLPYTGMPVIIPYHATSPHLGGVAQSLYPGTSIEQLDALVDLLMNFDIYTRQRAPVAPLVEAAGTAPSPDLAPKQ